MNADQYTQHLRERAEDAARPPIHMTREQARATIEATREYLDMHEDGAAVLDGWFSADQLIAIGWWLKNFPGEQP